MGSKFYPFITGFNGHFWSFVVGKSIEKQGIKNIWIGKFELDRVQNNIVLAQKANDFWLNLVSPEQNYRTAYNYH